MCCSAIDLFCGIGGLTHGLQMSGIPVVAGFDIDSSCKYAYESNNDATFVTADISKLLASDVNKYFVDNCTKVLVGCAPCQPFSKYTQRYRKEGHTGNKWRLLDSFARIVSELHPEIVSMENVPELASQSVFNDFVGELKANGYYVSWSVVFCPDYDVPQSRKRLVLLASRLGEIRLIKPLRNPSEYLTVRDVIGDLPALNAGETNLSDSLHCATRLSEINLKRIQQSKQGGTWRDWDEKLQLKCHKKNTGHTYPSVYGRMEWDKPAPTITTQFYGYGNGRFGHPEQDRALSLREGAMLQSFPQDYKFVEPGRRISKKELGIHIGNAVPVNLGKAIGESIKVHLQEMKEDE